MAKEYFFLSDAHLRNINDKNQKSLIKFLDRIKGKATGLYILGDLFDFWYGYKSVVYTQFVPVLAKLMELHDSGTALSLIEGNHEFRFDLFFKDIVGADVKDIYMDRKIEGVKFHLIHGDNINTKDSGHKILNFFLKNRLSYWAVNMTHPGFWWRAATYMSALSRDNIRDNTARLKKACREFANEKFMSGTDVVVIGHTHEPGLEKINLNGKEFHLIFLGDWITSFSYLRFDGKNFELLKFEP